MCCDYVYLCDMLYLPQLMQVEERRPYFTLDDRDIFSENDDAESNVAEKTNDESEIFI